MIEITMTNKAHIEWKKYNRIFLEYATTTIFSPALSCDLTFFLVCVEWQKNPLITYFIRKRATLLSYTKAMCLLYVAKKYM